MSQSDERAGFLHRGESAAENLFVSISGMIGAGKTTLARALGKIMNLPVYEEPVIDNVYLADFYRDMTKYSFALQIYLLNARFRAQQQIVWGGRGGVQDRTIYEDSVFAGMLRDSGHMEQRDYDTYISLFHNMSNFMTKPNLIVHLDVSPEESLERIKRRSRDCESTVSLEYLKALHAAYEQFIANISRVVPVIRVNYSTFPTAEDMVKMILEEHKRIQNIRYVDFSVSLSGSPLKPTRSDASDATVTMKPLSETSDSKNVSAPSTPSKPVPRDAAAGQPQSSSPNENLENQKAI